jgi:hypothetical protein
MHAACLITPQGPLLTVALMVSVPRQQALATAGQAVPPQLQANLLIDTGATCTNIDEKLIAALALTPTGSVKVHTPSTGQEPVEKQVYDIGLAIVAAQPPAVPFSFPLFLQSLPVLAADFSGQAIDGLLGRDVLRFARMTYGGPENLLLLSF